MKLFLGILFLSNLSFSQDAFEFDPSLDLNSIERGGGGFEIEINNTEGFGIYLERRSSTGRILIDDPRNSREAGCRIEIDGSTDDELFLPNAATYGLDLEYRIDRSHQPPIYNAYFTGEGFELRITYHSPITLELINESCDFANFAAVPRDFLREHQVGIEVYDGNRSAEENSQGSSAKEKQTSQGTRD